MTKTIALPALPLRLPSAEALLNWEAIGTGESGNRSVYKGRIGGSPLFFSAPRKAGWRLEAFSHIPDHAVDFSVRLVPDSHPPGAPHKMDSIRESLKLALTERCWDARKLTVEAVASDPVCALLAAALRLKCAEPDVEFALSSIAEGASSLGAPADSLKRRTYKAPPIDRLVQHHEIAFVGASNDQLPAALAVAFVERGRRKWKRLDVWSLIDDRLRQVKSDDRTPDGLVAARDRAERQLQQLLKVIADEWSVMRYSGFEIQYETAAAAQPVLCFASLWDWKKRNGYVHVSIYKSDENVRTADFENLIWSREEPPAVYRAAARAYQELRPVEVPDTSRPQQRPVDLKNTTGLIMHDHSL